MCAEVVGGCTRGCSHMVVRWVMHRLGAHSVTLSSAGTRRSSALPSHAASHQAWPCAAPTSLRNLFEGDALADGAAVPGPSPPKSGQPAGGGEAGGGERQPRTRFVPLVVEDSQKTNLNPLLMEANEDYAPREGGPTLLPARSRACADSVAPHVTCTACADGWLDHQPLPCSCLCATPAVPPLPEPGFVIAIDSFTVTRGQLVRVPNFFYQASCGARPHRGWHAGWPFAAPKCLCLSAKGGSAWPFAPLACVMPRWRPATLHRPPGPMLPLQKQKGSDYVNPRQGSFLPPSLASFSWPIDVWDLVVG